MSTSRPLAASTARIPMNQLMSHLRILSAMRLACVGTLLSAAATLASAEEPVIDAASPENPVASTRVPDGTTSITQIREQNAVTSVRVQRGANVYHVTPAEQIPYYQEGGRAATWEIFQFRSGSGSDRSALPPPQR